jgi:hypothetical protein
LSKLASNNDIFCFGITEVTLTIILFCACLCVCECFGYFKRSLKVAQFSLGLMWTTVTQKRVESMFRMKWAWILCWSTQNSSSWHSFLL